MNSSTLIIIRFSDSRWCGLIVDYNSAYVTALGMDMIVVITGAVHDVT